MISSLRYWLTATLLLTLCAYVTQAAPVGTTSQLVPRRSGKMTYYYPGLGSCGGTNGMKDMILAIGRRYGPYNSFCNRRVSITANGRTVIGTIVDTCEGCIDGHLDMSPAIWDALGVPLSRGVAEISWVMLGDKGKGNDDKGNDDKGKGKGKDKDNGKDKNSKDKPKEKAKAKDKTKTSKKELED